MLLLADGDYMNRTWADINFYITQREKGNEVYCFSRPLCCLSCCVGPGYRSILLLTDAKRQEVSRLWGTEE
jgi:hypothetical protein